MSTRAARAPRARRSARESLLSIAIVLEALVVFFVTLVVYALRVLPAGAAFGGGAALFVVLLIASRLMGKRIGVALGWVLQVVLVGLGVLVPLMYGIGAVFAGIWIFCFVMGTRLDKRTAAYLASTNLASTNDSENHA